MNWRPMSAQPCSGISTDHYPTFPTPRTRNDDPGRPCAGSAGPRPRLPSLSAVAAAEILLPRALPPFAAIRDAFGSASWNWIAAAAVLQFGSIGMLIRQQRRLLGSLGVQV